jgi:hypothetical protein
MYFPWNWEFGSAFANTSDFGGGGEHPKPPSVCHCLLLYMGVKLRLRMFETTVLRKILGLRVCYRKLERTAYREASSQNIIRVIKWHMKY